MKKIALLPLFLLSLSAVAQPPGPPPSPEKIFSDLDKDGDGLLSAFEAKGTPLSRDFNKADADGDGSITAAELEALFENMGPPPGREPPERPEE